MESQTELTPLQAAFADALVECGGNASEAARRAGYSPESARVIGPRLLRNERVQAEIRERQWLHVNGRLAAASLNVLRRALDMSDESVPWGVRIEAAKTVLDRAGLAAQDRPGRGGPGDGQSPDLSGLVSRLAAAVALRQAAKVPAVIDQPA